GYIEGNSVTLNGAPSDFTGSLILRATAAITLGVNLTAGGTVGLLANGITLTNSVTTAGGAVLVNLGATGVYDNGSSGSAGFTLNTSGKDLTLTVGSIRNLTATNPIFRIGDGILTLAGGVALANRSRTVINPDYSGSSYITSAADELKFTSPTVVYYFTSDTGAMLATDQAAVKVVGAFWLNASALSATDLGFKTDGGYTDNYTTSGLNDGAKGDYLWRVPGVITDNSPRKTFFTLAENRAVHFYELADPVMPTTTPLWLSRSKSLSFEGGNIFNAGLTIASAGAITQESGSFVSGGNLVITSSSSITLTSVDNLIAGLGDLNSTGAISITTGRALTLNGDLTSGGAIDLTAVGVSFGKSITVSGGDLTLISNGGAVTQAAGTGLTITGSKLIVRGSTAIILTNPGNWISSLGLLYTDGTIALTSERNLTLNSDLSGDGNSTVTITINNDAGLTLAHDIGTGSTVFLNLGKGSYDSRNGLASYRWTTNIRNLTLTAGDIKAGSGIIFAVGTARFRTNLTSTSPFDSKHVYINDTGNFSAADQQRLTELNSDAIFRSITQFNEGASRINLGTPQTDAADGSKYYTGNISVTNTTNDFPDAADTTVTFWNVRHGSVNSSHSFASTIRFDGVQNNFSGFRIGSDSTAKLVVAENSILKGDITVGSGGLWFEPRASVQSGTIRSVTGQDLKLMLRADFTQLPGDATFAAGADLIVQTNGNSLRLLNRANGFANLGVTTEGGSFQIASSRDLIFSTLSTSGGSVLLDTTGSIKALTIAAGSVSFRAGGSVALAGSFAGARGTGSSVWMSNSATAVLSGIFSDGAVTVTGTGSTLLAGDIIGHSAVNLGTAVVVARDSSVVSSGGRVEFARQVDSLFAAVRAPGLRLDSGASGLIVLGGSLGSNSLALGWVELNGLVSNPSSFAVYYPGGSWIAMGRQSHWRNGIQGD
ncbi:MAG: hypothetical protein ORO03_01740, partial [Alphaproteobacteria bacterium]|nr:hypothetical protein [Alphaproteobacteria bacterium]